LGEDARKPMPWAARDSWDHEFFDATKRLVFLRKSIPALADGGLRFITIEKDYFIFLRELKGETIFVLAESNTALGNR
jgi:glycosidase